jgi:hypothetical protein
MAECLMNWAQGQLYPLSKVWTELGADMMQVYACTKFVNLEAPSLHLNSWEL